MASQLCMHMANRKRRPTANETADFNDRRLRSVVKLPRSHTSGQHALSCTMVDPGQLEAAEWRLRNGRHAIVRVSPSCGLGARVSEVIEMQLHVHHFACRGGLAFISMPVCNTEDTLHASD
jgi:hypothetical protein